MDKLSAIGVHDLPITEGEVVEVPIDFSRVWALISELTVVNKNEFASLKVHCYIKVRQASLMPVRGGQNEKAHLCGFCAHAQWVLL